MIWRSAALGWRNFATGRRYVGPVAESVTRAVSEAPARVAPASPGRGEIARRRVKFGLLPGSLLAAMVSLAAAAWALHLWSADLSVPLRYGPVDDTKFYLMLIKGVIEHGWFQTNGNLGAPFGQQLYDFPQSADNLNLGLIRLLSVGSSDPAVVANLFYLATFALAAASAYAVLRALGLLAPAALVSSVLFSLLAYHFFRGESHLLLSAYYAVPLSCYLFLRLLDERPLFTRRRHGPRAMEWASPRTLTTVAMCVIIGSESLYYATFAEVLLVAATLIALLLRRARAIALGGVLVCTLIAATLAFNLAPSVLYRIDHGANTAVERSAADDEAHGLKLTNLVVPVPGDRVGVLRRISSTYDTAVAPAYCEACFAALGVVGTAGLGWLALCGLGSLIGAATWFGSRRLFRHSSVAVAIALAVGSLGGLSSLIEVFVTPDIRGWNRISVFVAFFALLAVGVLLDALVRCARARGGSYRLWPAVVIVVGVVGVYEQTSDYFVPTYAADASEYRSDGVFVGELQRRLPAGAAVFELPYVPFPEGYAVAAASTATTPFALSYELTRGYIHSRTLRWSYGAMKARAGDWAAQLASQPAAVVVPSVAAAGFQALWVDRSGYPTDAAQVRAALTGLVGQSPLVSPAGDLWSFDLRNYAAAQRRAYPPRQIAALRHATLWPLRASCSARGLALTNPSRQVRTATLRIRLVLPGAATGRVRISVPGGAGATFEVGGAGRTVSRRVSLRPGMSAVAVAVDGTQGLQLSDITLSDDALIPFAAAGSGTGGAADAPLGLPAPPCSLG